MAIMAQVTTPPSPPPNPSVSNIFRRRLGLPPLPSSEREVAAAGSGPVRCLFGAPDERVCNSMSQKVEEKVQWSFSRKWNFNITSKEAPTTLESSDPAQVESSKYDWSETYDEEFMRNCDRHRLEVPLAPKSSIYPCTLFYAPTDQESIPVPDEILVNSAMSACVDNSSLEISKQLHQDIPVDIIHDHKPKCKWTLNLFSVNTNDPSPPAESHSRPHTRSKSLRCLRIRNGSPARAHSPSKHYKQRAITDYVQVKKGIFKKIQ